MRKFVLALAFVVLLAGIPTLSGHDQQPNKVQQLMEKKLQHAQKVLAGVAMGDFRMMASNAEELIQISKLADWRVVKTPRYELHSNEFRRAAESLVQEANQKNVDASALAYVEMTLACVKCHKYVREIRMSRLDPPDLGRMALANAGR
jgi:hypothetical protein